MNKKVGRNDPCSCGSGKKYKKCCEAKHKHKKFEAKVLSSSSLSGSFFTQPESVTSLFNRNVKVVTPVETPPPSEESTEEEPKAPKEQEAPAEENSEKEEGESKKD